MAITRLTPAAIPGRRLVSFVGKAGVTRVLAVTDWSGPRYVVTSRSAARYASVDQSGARYVLTVAPPARASVFVPVASVSVTPATVTLATLGATQQLTATPKDASGSALSGRTVTWTTSSAAIATVSTTGLVTAIANGVATITATCEGVAGTMTTTVAANDIDTLIVNLGGNAAVLAIYDTRFGVTSTGGMVDSWADARGAGFGPTLTGAGATRPAWDATNKIITGDGVDDVLVSPASALFDLSPAIGVAFVGSMPANPAGNQWSVATIVDAAYAFGRYLLLFSSAVGLKVLGNQASTPASAAAGSATRRVFIAGKSAALSSVFLDVPNAAQVTAAGTAASAGGNNVLSLFSDRAPSIGSIPSAMRVVMVLNRQPTTADIATIRDWAVANHAAVLA